MILNYDDLYKIAEELGQLVGTALLSVYQRSERLYLSFDVSPRGRWIVLDLQAARPFIVSTELTEKIKKNQKATPILNFLKAHFVRRRLKRIEVGQKPDRIIKLEFEDSEDTTVLWFKCFPHGHELRLESAQKSVSQPRRPVHPKETTTFVEPEIVESWEHNDLLASQFLAKTGTQVTPVKAPPDSYHQKLIKKVERALSAISLSAVDGDHDTENQIKELEEKASQVAGAEIDSVFDEIKRLKKKSEINSRRKQELESELDRLKNLTPADAEGLGKISRVSPTEPRTKGSFAGVRVRFESSWELWVGRSAQQNDELLRLCSPHDIWIHLRDYPGAHGVLRGPKKATPKPSDIDRACQIVAVLSQKQKSKFSDGEPLDFIVVEKKFVKKPKGFPAGRVIVEREKVRRIAFKNVKFQVA